MNALLVLGHSFLRRVADKIAKDGLDLGDDIDNIAVRGNARQWHWWYGIRRLSSVVIRPPNQALCDLPGYRDTLFQRSTKDPVQLSREIIVAARTLGEVPSIRTVIISQVMRRADGRRHNFNHVRFILNDDLKRLATSYDHICTYNHRGLAIR